MSLPFRLAERLHQSRSGGWLQRTPDPPLGQVNNRTLSYFCVFCPARNEPPDNCSWPADLRGLLQRRARGRLGGLGGRDEEARLADTSIETSDEFGLVRPNKLAQ